MQLCSVLEKFSEGKHWGSLSTTLPEDFLPQATGGGCPQHQPSFKAFELQCSDGLFANISRLLIPEGLGESASQAGVRLTCREANCELQPSPSLTRPQLTELLLLASWGSLASASIEKSLCTLPFLPGQQNSTPVSSATLF